MDVSVGQEGVMSGQGNLIMRSGVKFDGVKVFSATMAHQREHLGESVTAWMADHPQYKVTEVMVTQSSDSAFHCITITVFYAEERDVKPAVRGTRKLPLPA
jgi:hypothetical protein